MGRENHHGSVPLTTGYGSTAYGTPYKAYPGGLGCYKGEYAGIENLGMRVRSAA